MRQKIRGTTAAWIARDPPGGRRTADIRLHLTLRFLGSYPCSRFPQAEAAAMEVASMVSGKGGLTLSLDLVGSFGHGAGWLGCRELPQRLVRLRNELDDVLHAFDNLVTESVTNVFRPHVTVLRDMRQPTDAVSIMPVYWPITDFALVHSELGHVPRYRIVKAYPLRC